jgi:hypothetical protein
MDSRPHIGVAGDIDVDRAPGWQLRDLVVGECFVVAAQATDEGDVGVRRDTDDAQIRSVGEQPCRADRGLARRTRDDDGRRAEAFVVADEIVNDERREEQRIQDHLVRLTLGVVPRVGVDEAVAVVRSRHRSTMGRGVDEATLVELGRFDDEFGTHREVPVNATPDRKFVVLRLDDIGESPHRHPAPFGAGFVTRRRRGREEVPVLQGIAKRRIADVVRRKREVVDA